VDQTRLMSGVQSRPDLLHHLHGELGVDRPLAFGEDVTEGAALDQPHVQIEQAVDLAIAVDRHHVGITQAGRSLGLPTESLLEDAV
jgi:hypothetical protein